MWFPRQLASTTRPGPAVLQPDHMVILDRRAESTRRVDRFRRWAVRDNARPREIVPGVSAIQRPMIRITGVCTEATPRPANGACCTCALKKPRLALRVLDARRPRGPHSPARWPTRSPRSSFHDDEGVRPGETNPTALDLTVGCADTREQRPVNDVNSTFRLHARDLPAAMGVEHERSEALAQIP
jgi:hypothetical protein